jgi:hypothetical protein
MFILYFAGRLGYVKSGKIPSTCPNARHRSIAQDRFAVEPNFRLLINWDLTEGDISDHDCASVYR